MISRYFYSSIDIPGEAFIRSSQLAFSDPKRPAFENTANERKHTAMLILQYSRSISSKNN